MMIVGGSIAFPVTRIPWKQIKTNRDVARWRNGGPGRTIERDGGPGRENFTSDVTVGEESRAGAENVMVFGNGKLRT